MEANPPKKNKVKDLGEVSIEPAVKRREGKKRKLLQQNRGERTKEDCTQGRATHNPLTARYWR